MTVTPHVEGELPDLRIIDTNEYPFDDKKTYYLAGPMSGYPAFNFDSFTNACMVLRNEDIKVESPHEIDHGETEENRGKLPYQQYIDAGLEMLGRCQGIILLPGWPQSTGAIIELKFAIEHDMPVYFYHEPTEHHDDVELVCMNRKPPA